MAKPAGPGLKLLSQAEKNGFIVEGDS
jgi:hypothetical protein